MRLLNVVLFLIAAAGVPNTVLGWSVEGRATAVDADTIDIGPDTRIRLFGIDAPEIGQGCQRKGGGTWKCGVAARDRLSDLVDRREVLCRGTGQDDYGRLLGWCTIGGVEVNSLLISEGLAWAFVKYSDDYVPLEREARRAHIGVWQAPTQTPWDYRAEKWEVGKQESPDGCPVKGNINREGERIYHAPWSPWYSRTKVSIENGERWFCSEAEALAAGWRAPYWTR